jgi:hypothetical protein
MDDWVLVHMLLDFCVDRTGRLTLEKPHTYAEKGAHAMFKRCAFTRYAHRICCDVNDIKASGLGKHYTGVVLLIWRLDNLRIAFEQT